MPQKASSRIFILTVVFFLLTGLFIILLVNIQMRREALREAEIKAQLLLNRNLATHTYFSRQLKPALFKIMGEIAPEGYFDPVWMSSTYAVREMVNYTRSPAEGDFYYKECAVNARSPQNEADCSGNRFHPCPESESGARSKRDRAYYRRRAFFCGAPARGGDGASLSALPQHAGESTCRLD